VIALVLAACGHAPREPARVATPEPPAKPTPEVHHLQELESHRHEKLLAIDWSAVHLESAADALALWQRIAPTGADWEDKLAELPDDSPIAHDLAIALLNEGNFACPALPPLHCGGGAVELPSPDLDATLADPCLRRMLALWSLGQLEATDFPRVKDALRAIVAIPPPESQLVATALRFVPEAAQDDRLDLIAIAWAAGQHELVDGALNTFDEAHLMTAATKVHVDGALDALAAPVHRATFLAAVVDEKLATAARVGAIAELAAPVEKLEPDLHAALVTAAKSSDCTVAATAARMLENHGDHKFVPKLPSTRSSAVMMRALCVLASYEQQQRSDQPSYLPGYIPASGLLLVRVTYDAYADPKTDQDSYLVMPDEVVLPEIDDLVRAMRLCTGTTCRSDEHEFQFMFKPGGGGLLLSRLDVIDRPPCADK
jgi:hypothetical protein